MLTVVVQAGGESHRMGRDKGLVSFLGQPLVGRVVGRIGLLADEVIVTTNHPEDYQFLDLPLFPDILPARGALSGLYTALRAASHPYVIVVACDMPFINRDLLAAERELLIEQQTDAVVPMHSQGMEPFHAIYNRMTCLPLVEAAIQAGQRRAHSWFPQARITWMNKEKILEMDPYFLSFLNVNTPGEVRAAELLALELGQD